MNIAKCKYKAVFQPLAFINRFNNNINKKFKIKFFYNSTAEAIIIYIKDVLYLHKKILYPFTLIKLCCANLIFLVLLFKLNLIYII